MSRGIKLMNKLKSISIKNYKCFKNVSFRLKDTNILIGENNAGKSTAVEALKLIAFAIDKLHTGKLSECPDFVSENMRDRCICLNIETLLIDISLCTYKYQGGPSIITGYFENNIKITVYIKNSEVYAIAYGNGACLNRKAEIEKAEFPSIYVMPHFNLLRDMESLISEKRTARDRFNYRSSLHFRNELYTYKTDIPTLNSLLHSTWPPLYLSVEYTPGLSEYIDTLVRDNDFSAEVKSYGSGLQMWLQILWFLCKIPNNNCTVIFDEPDVYIHADLQRKLFHLVKDKFNQIIIATHSIEIITEANLADILIVDKSQSSFNFCKEKTALNSALKSIGSTQNLMLTKIHKHNKCLFVEGDDVSILDSLFKIAINDKSKSLKDFANCKLDGKDNYKEAFGAANLFYEDSDGTFKTFCILDRDYNESYNHAIKKGAEANHIKLYILDALEIENYIIIPRIYAKLLNIDVSIINSHLEQFTEELKGETFDRVLQEKVLEYRKLKSGSNLSAISKETREYISEHWNTLEDKIKLVPGKELKAKVYDWMKTAYGFSCNDKKILALMESSDIPDELIAFLKELNT